MEFSRPGYWSGEPFPSPGDLPNPGFKPRSPTLQVYSLPAEPQGTLWMDKVAGQITSGFTYSVNMSWPPATGEAQNKSGTCLLLGLPDGSTVKILPAMQETRVGSLGQEDTLEERTEAFSSVLGIILWAERSGGLWSRGLQGGRQDWVCVPAYLL